MNCNVQLIYDLIRYDLKSKGWDDASIAEAVAECQRERQSTGADDNTICVKELFYLSQESLQKVVKQMDNKKPNDSFFNRLKTCFVNWVKVLWSQNLEAKVGLILLVPSLLSVIVFILNLFDANIEFFEGEYRYSETTPTIPIYIGLMAIAGAYLIKDNFKKSE